MEGRRRLEEDDVHLVSGDRAVLDAAGHNEELPRADRHVAIAQLHGESPLDDEEELVLVRMEVPVELAEQLGDLHVLTVELPNDARVPVVGEAGELLGEIDDGHGGLPVGGALGSRGGRPGGGAARGEAEERVAAGDEGDADGGGAWVARRESRQEGERDAE